MKFSRYQAPQQDRIFFESLYEFITTVVCAAFSPEHKVRIENEMHRILRSQASYQEELLIPRPVRAAQFGRGEHGKENPDTAAPASDRRRQRFQRARKAEPTRIDVGTAANAGPGLYYAARPHRHRPGHPAIRQEGEDVTFVLPDPAPQRGEPCSRRISDTGSEGEEHATPPGSLRDDISKL